MFSDVIKGTTVSLIFFYVFHLSTIQYLLILNMVVLCFLIRYGKSANRMYIRKGSSFLIGNVVAFAVTKWMVGGSMLHVMNLPVGVLCLMLVIQFCILQYFAYASDRESQDQMEEALFEERRYDLERICGMISKVNILGVNADWGEGKSFLLEKLCRESDIQKEYETIWISLLTCQMKEVETVLMDEIDRVLDANHILSGSSRRLKRLLRSHQYTEVLADFFGGRGDSISISMDELKKDIAKLDKKLLIIFDDVDRVQNMDIVKSMFAISERLASERIRIIYQYEQQNLDLDRAYLEKYIPYTVKLTPLSFESIVEKLWNPMQMAETDFLLRDISGMAAENLFNPSLPKEVSEKLTLSWQWGSISVRKVKIYLKELKAYYEANSAFHTKQKRDTLAKVLFIKNFRYDLYEQFEIGKSIVDTMGFRIEDESFSIWQLLDKNAEEWESILQNPDNRDSLGVLAFFPYEYRPEILEYEQNYQKERSPEIRREKLANFSPAFLQMKEKNEGIDRVIWNVLGNGDSEYTNVESFVAKLDREVLKAEEDRTQAWNHFLQSAAHERFWKNNRTLFRLFGDSYLPVFKALRVAEGTTERQWQNWISFYFDQVGKEGIRVEMVECLNYYPLTKKDIYISIITRFCNCQILGNMNGEPGFARFLRNYLRPVFLFGYAASVDFEPDHIDAYTMREHIKNMPEHLDGMIKALNDEKQNMPLKTMKTEYDAMIDFCDKCKQLIESETRTKPRQFRLQSSSRSVQEHQAEYEMLTELKKQVGEDEFYREVEERYRTNKLNPHEVHLLIHK